MTSSLADARPAARHVRIPSLYAGLAILLLPLMLASLCIGETSFAPWTAAAALWGTGSEWVVIVVQELRLPRTLLAAAVGGMLGLGGAALQGLTRNPLAEPGLLGASGGAALGAVLVLYSGLAVVSDWLLPAGAVAGSLLAVSLLLAILSVGASPLTLILCGVAIGSLSSALVSLAVNLSPNPFATLEVSFWLLGSLEDRSLDHVLLSLPLIAVGAALLLRCGTAFDALTLGDEGARALGIDLKTTYRQVALGLGLGVGGAVAVSGTIGFVGLIVPHLLRPFVGHRAGRLMVPSALGGAVLLLAADIAVRVIPTAQTLRLGVVTALLGVPFLLALILLGRRRLA
ncbi:MAG: iron chelate uptake ABC transporter family permease subunit [Alphaproteobacteria bacterium]|jgi:iron complex transport system permease protein|nr:iron chelate uptake ABC transporter family permease subunit [Alphaproteobacteria bacterium]